MKSPTFLQRLIRTRRKDIGLTQTELSHRIGLRSPEFIALVEHGQRNVGLNRIPLLADALLVDRKDLCKVALFEEAPSLYYCLFGREDPTQKQLGGSDESQQAASDDILAKVATLPRDARITLLNMLDHMYAAATATER